jgi:hypothetical protein
MKNAVMPRTASRGVVLVLVSRLYRRTIHRRIIQNEQALLAGRSVMTCGDLISTIDMHDALLLPAALTTDSSGRCAHIPPCRRLGDSP